MSRHNAIGQSLKLLRKAKSLTQEDFYEVSGRTYISQIERGVKAPTIDKVDTLAEVLTVHPLSLLTAAYLPKLQKKHIQQLLRQIEKELIELIEK